MARTPKPSGRRRPLGRGELPIVRPNTWMAEPAIWVYCEGRETEPNYLDVFRHSPYRVTNLNIVRPTSNSRGNAQRILQDIRDARRRGDIEVDDLVFWVFDAESAQEGIDVTGRIGRARAQGVRALPIVSNPCFEYWLLLHFERTDRPCVDAAEMVAALERHIPNYDKAMDVRPFVCERITQALDNAARLRENATEHWDAHPNPSTDVDILVHALLEASKMPSR